MPCGRDEQDEFDEGDKGAETEGDVAGGDEDVHVAKGGRGEMSSIEEKVVEERAGLNDQA